MQEGKQSAQQPAPAQTPAAPWHFTAGETHAAAGDAAHQEQTSPAAVPVSWTVPEFAAHDKPAGWYVVLAAGVAVAAGAIYLITHRLVDVIAIVILGVLIGITAARRPRTVTYTADATGLSTPQTRYLYNQFKSFALMDDGPLMTITFTPLKRFRPPVVVSCSPDDAPKVLAVLQPHLPLERRERSLMSNIIRQSRF